MTKLTMTKAAEAVGLSARQLYRHVEKGKVSRNNDGSFDTAELARAYGELKEPTINVGIRHGKTKSRHDTIDVMPFLEEKISMLEGQIEALKYDRQCDREEHRVDQEERRDRERELRDIIKRQTLLLEYKPERQSSPEQKSQFLSWLNAILIGCGTVITITLVFVAWVFPHLG